MPYTSLFLNRCLRYLLLLFAKWYTFVSATSLSVPELLTLASSLRGAFARS